MTHRIVTITDRPDLIRTVALWLWHEWARERGRLLYQVTDRLEARRGAAGLEETLIALDGQVPIGTASLVHEDLESRQDLTPWLASVYVDPPFRGQGHARSLVRAIEATARARGVGRFWLYTQDAAGLYAKLGWIAAGTEQSGGHPVTLMYRDPA